MRTGSMIRALVVLSFGCALAASQVSSGKGRAVKPTGCQKGCRCGNSCIDCSKTCRK